MMVVLLRFKLLTREDLVFHTREILYVLRSNISFSCMEDRGRYCHGSLFLIAAWFLMKLSTFYQIQAPNTEKAGNQTVNFRKVFGRGWFRILKQTATIQNNFFQCFSQSLQESSRIASQIRPRLLLSTSFQLITRYYQVTGFYLTQSCLMAAHMNKEALIPLIYNL